MIPDEWPSIRSMARWVLPVLVGPSTAVTPTPRARASRFTDEENDTGMGIPSGGGRSKRWGDTPIARTGGTTGQSRPRRGRRTAGVATQPGIVLQARRTVGASGLLRAP